GIGPERRVYCLHCIEDYVGCCYLLLGAGAAIFQDALCASDILRRVAAVPDLFWPKAPLIAGSLRPRLARSGVRALPFAPVPALVRGRFGGSCGSALPDFPLELRDLGF